MKPKLPSFGDFLDSFFKSAFGVKHMREEWALALYGAGEVMKDCEEIIRFRKVVDNEVS